MLEEEPAAYQVDGITFDLEAARACLRSTREWLCMYRNNHRACRSRSRSRSPDRHTRQECESSPTASSYLDLVRWKALKPTPLQPPTLLLTRQPAKYERIQDVTWAPHAPAGSLDHCWPTDATTAACTANVDMCSRLDIAPGPPVCLLQVHPHGGQTSATGRLAALHGPRYYRDAWGLGS